MDLYRRSISVILQNQHGGGAYVASPAFANYRYCWLRDGSYIAYAMDRVGEHQSADAFFGWVNRTIAKYAYKVDLLEELIKNKESNLIKGILHTRYTLDGEEESPDSQWGNFQIDGYGTWLWALAEHVRMTGNYELLTEYSNSIATSLRYLNATWRLPNYDCWEEHPEYLHPYSLSAVYGGIKAISDLVGAGRFSLDPALVENRAGEVKQFLSGHALLEDIFVKHVWPASKRKCARPVEESGIDASLLGLAVPYRLFELDDPRIRTTVSAIEKELHRPDGGVYRYKEDVYFGGGEWLLLSAWLGWYLACAGELGRARDFLEWIEANMDAQGNLPEQVSDHLLAPKEYEPWIERWGPVASPLLWSHAMYLILVEELNDLPGKI